DQQKLPEASAALKKSIQLDPKLAQAHGGLALVLLQQGQFAEAQQATLKCLKLLPPTAPQRDAAQRQLQQCERLLALDRRRAAILGGQAQAQDGGEALELAGLCRQYKRQYAAAARFYGDAFRTEPRLAERYRYAAAGCAALAGTGRGEAAVSLP